MDCLRNLAMTLPLVLLALGGPVSHANSGPCPKTVTAKTLVELIEEKRDGATQGGEGAGPKTAELDHLYEPRRTVQNKGPGGKPMPGKVLRFKRRQRFNRSPSPRDYSFHGQAIWDLWDSLTPEGKALMRRLGLAKNGKTIRVVDAKAANANLKAVRTDPEYAGRLNSEIEYVGVNGKGQSIAPREYLENIGKKRITLDEGELLLHDHAHGIGFLSMADDAFRRTAARARLISDLENTLRQQGIRDRRILEAVAEAVEAESDELDSASMSLASAIGRKNRTKAKEALRRLTRGTDSMYDDIRRRIDAAGGDRKQTENAGNLLHQMRNSSKPALTGTPAPSDSDLNRWADFALNAFDLPPAVLPSSAGVETEIRTPDLPDLEETNL